MKNKPLRKSLPKHQPYVSSRKSRLAEAQQGELPAKAPSASDTDMLSSVPRNTKVLYRDLCQRAIRSMNPGIKPRDDFDIVELSLRRYSGEPAEVYAALDEQLDASLVEDTREEWMKGMTKMLNLYMEPTGIKPFPGEEDDCVLIRRIPDTKFSIRLFPSSSSDREYCMGIVDETGHPVNRPFEFELLAGLVRSIEEAYGHKREDILPGEEKYILRDGQVCLMTRPEKPNTCFTIPVRKRPVENPVVEENVINIDFPKEIHLAP